MKVLDIYGKKDLDVLTCNGGIASEIMDDFFSNFPKLYKDNYDKNGETLEIWKIDEHYSGATGGEYYDLHNLILLRKYSSLIHELMHMSSCDYITRNSAFFKSKQGPLFEMALVEGMTEYFASLALKSKPTDYFFEVFTASMLDNIEGIFEPYFIPNHDRFISLFPNKKDIVSLMYSLNYYSNKTEAMALGEIEIDEDVVMTRIEHSINDTIDSLINIQLSMKMGRKNDKLYGEKFMSLISGDDLVHYLGDFYDDYLDYANDQINKRILRRIR